MNKGRN